MAKQLPLNLGWCARGWIEPILTQAREVELHEGFDYAKQGQTRSLVFEPGRVVASVQGRAIRPYKVVMQVQTYTDEQWDAVVGALAERAIYGGKLLAGEMPEGINEVFNSLGLELFPKAVGDVVAACTAPHDRPWCKHVCCVTHLVAEALEKDPFLILVLRGMPAMELLERLRDRRAEATAPAATGQPYATPVALGGIESSPPLESVLDDFWESRPGLAELETPLRKPEISHAILRRLGPSPFIDGKFPLVGLLATCYDTISENALNSLFTNGKSVSSDPEPVDDTLSEP